MDGSELYKGLGALHWNLATFEDDRRDYGFFLESVKAGNGKALDIGCGTGRLLVPFRELGYDVDGVDLSEEMLAGCRRRLDQHGVTADLFLCSMQTLDLPRRYRTLTIPCGSFVLVVDREEALESLRRFRRHLEPGGRLAFNVFLEYDLYQLRDRDLPTPWEHRASYRRDSDGAELRIYRRWAAIDVRHQVAIDERHWELWREGVKIAEECRQGAETWYYPREIETMLEMTGFLDIEITGDYSGEPVGPTHHLMCVTAHI